MIGQAVFLVASDMSREVGSMWKVLFVWVVGGVIVLFGALCYAELGAALPEAGGDYVYLSRGLGPWAGFLYGWTFCMIMRPGAAAGMAAGLLRFVGFLAPSVTAPIFVSTLHLPFLSQPYQVTFTAAQPMAAVVVVFATVLNYLGVRTVGHVQIFLTALKMATIVAILVLGVMADNPHIEPNSFREIACARTDSGIPDSPCTCDVRVQRISIPRSAGRRGSQSQEEHSKSCNRGNVTGDRSLCHDQLGVLSPTQHLSSGAVVACRF